MNVRCSVSPRPPDAPLAVEKALETLGRPGPRDVEMRHGEGAPVVEAQVAGLSPVSRYGEEGSPLHLEADEAVAPGVPGGERAVLRVGERDGGSLKGRGRAQVGGHQKHRAVLARLGDETDVGHEDVARGADVVVIEVLVVARVAGVAAAFVS